MQGCTLAPVRRSKTGKSHCRTGNFSGNPQVTGPTWPVKKKSIGGVSRKKKSSPDQGETECKISHCSTSFTQVFVYVYRCNLYSKRSFEHLACSRPVTFALACAFGAAHALPCNAIHAKHVQCNCFSFACDRRSCQTRSIERSARISGSFYSWFFNARSIRSRLRSSVAVMLELIYLCRFLEKVKTHSIFSDTVNGSDCVYFHFTQSFHKWIFSFVQNGLIMKIGAKRITKSALPCTF